MKKFLTAILIVMLTAFLAACSGDSDEGDNPEEGQEEDGQEENGEEEGQGEEGQGEEAQQEAINVDEIESDEVVATVNDTEILGEEFKSSVDRVTQMYQQQLGGQGIDQMQAQIQQQALDQLINREVIKQEAQSQDLSVSDEEISEEYDNQINGLIEQSQGEFEDEEQVLEQVGMNEEELKDSLQTDLLIQKYLDENLEEPEVTDEEIQEQYDNMKAQMEESESGEEVPSLEEVEDSIVQQIQSQKQGQQQQELIQNLREDYEIETLV
ncbi:SurA N-terminal domain-containing protein [Aquisalibacillus elongatus]|uniref:SurA-like protein n=1 Tax=Aquisalibacillus elongatus TaxID=485577 RepID=A0A3N5BCQ5_9BACI|nr:SurA N-terminal domain-containing protein [Aquisalibacillus elongatus]RPF53170.1 SurA-like protein [Aquisalibacillus elongatus]